MATFAEKVGKIVGAEIVTQSLGDICNYEVTKRREASRTRTSAGLLKTVQCTVLPREMSAKFSK